MMQLTPVKGEERKERVGRASDHRAVLRFSQADGKFLSQNCLLNQSHIKQVWVTSSKPVVFSHWLEAAQRKNGLRANAMIDLQDNSWRLPVKLMSTDSPEGDMSITFSWMPCLLTQINIHQSYTKAIFNILYVMNLFLLARYIFPPKKILSS